MNALVRPRISFHRAGAIKRLKNGGVTKPELKGKNQFNQLFILPGYTKIALVLSTLIKSPPVFLFLPRHFFFLEATCTVDI